MVVACKPGPMTVSLLLQQKDGAFVFTNPYSYALHGIITRSNFDTIVGQLNYAAAKLETEPKIGCVQRMLMKTPIISPLAAASIQRKMHTQMCTELEAACKRIKSEFAEQITMSLFAISDREYYRVDMDVKVRTNNCEEACSHDRYESMASTESLDVPGTSSFDWTLLAQPRLHRLSS